MMLNMVFKVGEALTLVSEKTTNLSFMDRKVTEVAAEKLPEMYKELKKGQDQVGFGTAISLIGQAIREIVVMVWTASVKSEQRLADIRSSFTKTMFVLANRNLLNNPMDKEAQSFAELAYVSLFNNVMERTAPTTGSGDDETQASVEGLLKGTLKELQERDQAAAAKVSFRDQLAFAHTVPNALFTIE